MIIKKNPSYSLYSLFLRKNHPALDEGKARRAELDKYLLRR